MEEVQRKVDAVCTLHPNAKPSPRSDENLSFNMSLHRDVMQGTGFYDTLVNDINNISDVKDLADKMGLAVLDESNVPFDESNAPLLESSALIDESSTLLDESSTSAPAKSWSLPVVNYLNIPDSFLRDAVVAEALEDDRDRLRAYLSNRPLGIGLISGPVRPITYRCVL